ncbi:MAG: hypothetical protein CM15mP25_4370 [Gammaproteobacteria bacterium]|nr:MAG: hypothetical protein CM15mP25_4370 [Gammaproteobacteria bacterium]
MRDFRGQVVGAEWFPDILKRRHPIAGIGIQLIKPPWGHPRVLAVGAASKSGMTGARRSFWRPSTFKTPPW